MTAPREQDLRGLYCPTPGEPNMEGRRRLLAWLADTGAHPASCYRRPCWILGCRRGYTGGPCELHVFPDDIEDHVQAFVRAGKPLVWTSQPYGVSEESRRELDRFCALWGLTWLESKSRSWWCPGGTTLIAIARKGGDLR